MKTNKSIVNFLGILLLTLFALAGCKEDDTLNGAEEVYIEIISPKNNSSITLGQKVALKAAVTNVSGDTIRTPLEWVVDDASVLEIKNDTLTAVAGSQNKITNIRVKLTNGKYALAQVKVITHIPVGVAPLLEGPHYSYDLENDTVWFTINPKGLLLDYDPVVTNSNPEAVIPHSNYLTIDKEVGLVGYSFASPRGKAGSSTLELQIGPDGDKIRGSAEVVLSPTIVSSFGTNFNPTQLVNTTSKIMNINATDTVWAYTEVSPRYAEDFQVAVANYDWSFSGDGGMISVFGAVQANNGHNVWAEIKSSSIEGQLTVKFNSYGSELVATIDVQNYAIRYPVNQLLVDKSTLSVPMESGVYITPSIVPESSYAFHQPQFKSENPLIAKIGSYEGNSMRIIGVNIGKTNIIITANDKSIVVPVEVTEKVNQVTWVSRQLAMFEGVTAEWEAAIETPSGRKYPAEWTSDNKDVAIVRVNENDTEKAMVTAVTPGVATIMVEAGGKKTDPSVLKVLAVPSDVIFTNENTKLDGNAVLYEDAVDKLLVVVESTNKEYRVWNIYIDNVDPSGDFSGTFELEKNPMTFNVDGASCTVKSGTVILSPYHDDGSRTYTIDLTLEAGSKTFKLKADNLKGF